MYNSRDNLLDKNLQVEKLFSIEGAHQFILDLVLQNIWTFSVRGPFGTKMGTVYT